MIDFLLTLTNLATLIFVLTSMLSMGLSLSIKDIIAPLKNLKLVILALVANFILVPILAYLIQLIVPLSEGLTIGLILVALAAGAPFLPKLAQTAKGDLALSVGLMVMLMVVTILFMPIVLPLVLEGVTVNPWDIARPLIFLMLIPLAVGLLVKWRYENIASTLQPYMAQSSSFAMILLLFSGLAANFKDLVAIIGSGGIIAALLFLGTAFAAGFFAGGKNPKTRSVLALGTAQRNLSAALVIGTSSFSSDPHVLIMILVIGLIGLILLMVTAGEMGRRSGATENQL